MASPAAAVLERRLSRTTPEKRKLPCGDSGSEGSETGSDGEWSGDDDPLSDHGREDEDEEEDEAVLRGRVRPHAVESGSRCTRRAVYSCSRLGRRLGLARLARRRAGCEPGASEGDYGAAGPRGTVRAGQGPALVGDSQVFLAIKHPWSV